MKLHKNARLTPQGRLLLVQRITERGWTVAAVAPAPPDCRSGGRTAGWRAIAPVGRRRWSIGVRRRGAVNTRCRASA
jgi:hypothetical protein